MKLKSKKSKKRLIIIILAIVAIILIAAVAVGVVIITKYFPSLNEPEDKITGISVNEVPKTSYFVGDKLDLSGLRIQVITNKVGDIRFVSYPDSSLSIGECDMSVAGEKLINVSWGGFTTSFTIMVSEYSEPEPTIESIEVCELISSYTIEVWNENGPNLYGAYLKITYSDGSVRGSYEETPLLWDYIEPLSKVSSAGSTEMIINYIEKGISVSTTVTITITE